MKVVHVLKRIETIDQDIKDLKKLEKSIARDKSFSTPIYISIEQQINILVGERVKLFGLEIGNPPEELAKEIDGEETEEFKPLLRKTSAKKSSKRSKKRVESKAKQQSAPEAILDDDEDDDLPFKMLTQDQIDDKIKNIQDTPDDDSSEEKVTVDSGEISDESVKLIDVALAKGTIDKKEVVKEKKRVRFFKDNIPGGEY